MTTSFSIFNAAMPTVGLRTRAATQGPEQALVELYLRSLHAYSPGHGRERAVFVEPYVGNSAPDIVVVDYNPKTYQSWHEAGSLIVPDDHKVMHYLWQVRGGSSEAIAEVLGASVNSIDRSLGRLDGVGFVRRRGIRWEPSALERVFGIRRLVAVEAKISGLRRVVHQANNNRWFATESYILTNAKTLDINLLDSLASLGVGALTGNGLISTALSAPRVEGPVSHGSWMFNEWLGALLSGQEACLARHD